jgi:hypothetical protein
MYSFIRGIFNGRRSPKVQDTEKINFISSFMCVYETWSLALREDYKLRCSQAVVQHSKENI